MNKIPTEKQIKYWESLKTSMKGKNTWSKGSKLSEETKRKISESGKGKKRPPRSDEYREKQRLAKLGKKHNHKTSNGGGWKLSEETKKKLSESLKGKIYSEERRKAMSEGQKGKKYGEEARKNMAKSRARGEKHWKWNPDREKVKQNRDRHSMHNPEYKKWRLEVFTRDEFTCRLHSEECNGQIQAHHIYRWIDYPELRYIINNGITLCQAHHPRKIAEEKRMIPIFQELLSVSE